MKTEARHFWEGIDSNGREVRATYLAEPPQLFWADVKYPVVCFRTKKAWEREPGYLEALRTAVADTNSARARQAAAAGKINFKLAPQPRAGGVTWPVVALVELKDLYQTIKFRTPLGLEPKFRPGMARLSVEQLGALNVALDAWMDSGGKSFAKQLRTGGTQ